MNDANESISLADAAKSLAMSWERAWRLLLRGELIGRREGRSWRVSRTSVDAYRASRDDHGQTEAAALGGPDVLKLQATSGDGATATREHSVNGPVTRLTKEQEILARRREPR